MHNLNSSSQAHWFNAPNLLTAQLPSYSTPAELARAIAFDPLEGLDLSQLTQVEIDCLLVGEKTPLEPTSQCIRTTLTWNSMLHAGLRRRNPEFAAARRLYWEAVTHQPNDKTHPFLTPTRGISVQITKGSTGTGKSVTMQRFCSLLPPFIRHGKNEEAGWQAMTQLVYLEVSISHDGTRGGFLTGILHEMDKVLGTTYATDLPRKFKSVENLAVATVCRLIAHYTGIIFLEEGQLRNLVIGPHSQHIQNFLLMLMNSGIPIVFLGNELAFDWITHSQDSTRLYSTPCEHFTPVGAIAIDEDDRVDADTDWDAIGGGVMRFYCLNIPITDPDECKRLLRRYSGGIARLALCLWCMAQRDALFGEADSLCPEDITAVYESPQFRKHRPLADGFTYRNAELLMEQQDVDVGFYKKHWQFNEVPSEGVEQQSGAPNQAGKRKSNAGSNPATGGPTAGQTQFKSEQTKKTNKKAKREELNKTLSDDDLRRGLKKSHMDGLAGVIANAGAEA
ncbi:hypothetical protein VVD49_16385 [Uliginosibacterium sp. H3]|uniref:AAA+ ATPase domain-containing protein n=1 Tax=Uliginosibacterium silvisoli TaxID=3114758 RepID=A0ABU6K5Y8_9RHOO|nr:hypothetical protein [Uliginosibacterium sp. H3]